MSVKTVKKRRKRRISKLAILPNLLTLGNGICGLGAISLVTRDDQLTAADQQLFQAGLLIFLGMLFDLFDGQVARLTKQTSRFGAELDSLCDVITFGVAPMFIMLRFSGMFSERLLWGVGALYVACTTMRLARYNVEQANPSGSGSFFGLPSPAAAGTIAAFAIGLSGLRDWTDAANSEAKQLIGMRLIDTATIVLPLLTLALAFLMVSRVRYPHVFNQFLRGKFSFYQLVEIVFIVGAVLIVQEVALPVLFCCFVLSPFVRPGFLSAFRGAPAKPVVTPNEVVTGSDEHGGAK
ncbi:MAG: CDP-diacylglycerol--serine O-phosphatidyltransferase [Pirellulaceae bacterium]|nr:CDP-diacylglycerol--serine O-phosphatidyltransferase [Pirellulaceae bacterium]